MHRFRNLFVFNAENAMRVGVEREAFIIDSDGEIIPTANSILKYLNRHVPIHSEHYGYELSACQIESRIGPHHLQDIERQLFETEACLTDCLSEMNRGWRLSHKEVAPETMPLDVYPDPSGRYQEIVKSMPREVLSAACRVIGTHVHVGMPDHETALMVYNSVVGQTEKLCQLGDKSRGERLKIYKVVAPNCQPPIYRNWRDFHSQAVAKGFNYDPRKCWTLIRISKHGTIEFRMFGATADIREIVSWVRCCHSLCEQALLKSQVPA
ncbi:MAG: glutamate-cysteine ligase family protein [Candidatus Paceibacterota bacterium]